MSVITARQWQGHQLSNPLGGERDIAVEPVYPPLLPGHCSGSASKSNDGFPLAVPWTDAIDASAQQLLLLNPQGTVALRVGEAIGTRTERWFGPTRANRGAAGHRQGATQAVGEVEPVGAQPDHRRGCGGHDPADQARGARVRPHRHHCGVEK